MGIILAGLMPHPPIAVPEIGKGHQREVSRTQRAMRDLAERIKQLAPDTIIMITPHGPVFRDAVAVLEREEFEGDLSDFGARSVSFMFKNDEELTREIYKEATKSGVKMIKMASDLDHGVMVPLYYLREAGLAAPLSLLTTAFLPIKRLYSLGQAIQRATQRLKRRAVLIASGDLSHRLTRDAPAGYDPAGETFDKTLVDYLNQRDFDAILTMNQRLIEDAGECGYKPIVTLLGALSGSKVDGGVLSYEGPFGVGYAVASFEVEEPAKDGEEKEMSELTRLAKNALETYVRDGHEIDPPDPLPEGAKTRAGVFVSLKAGGELRGCIGTFEPTTQNIATEIIRNAIQAGTRDPRFPPVQAEELGEITYSVDVLTEPEPVRDVKELDPKKYGVIVKKGRSIGLLLPDLDGVDSVARQLEIAKVKAGIHPRDPKVTIFKFEVKRYH